MSNESNDFVPNTQNSIEDLDNIGMIIEDLESTPSNSNIQNFRKKKRSNVWIFLTEKLNNPRKCTYNICGKDFTCDGLGETRHLGKHVTHCLEKL